MGRFWSILPVFILLSSEGLNDSALASSFPTHTMPWSSFTATYSVVLSPGCETTGTCPQSLENWSNLKPTKAYAFLCIPTQQMGIHTYISVLPKWRTEIKIMYWFCWPGSRLQADKLTIQSNFKPCDQEHSSSKAAACFPQSHQHSCFPFKDSSCLNKIISGMFPFALRPLSVPTIELIYCGFCPQSLFVYWSSACILVGLEQGCLYGCWEETNWTNRDSPAAWWRWTCPSVTVRCSWAPGGGRGNGPYPGGPSGTEEVR